MFSRSAQFASVTLIAGMMLSLGSGLAYAQVPSLDIDIPTPDVNININPDVPTASEINCQIYADLIARGEPIPPGFDGSGCGGSGGGGGGGSTAACADGIDNDGDNLVDSADPGCSSSADTDETNTSGGGGGDGGGNGGGGTGGGSGGGNSGGAAPACEDNVDNDGDGLKDMSDPGCESAADMDESNSGSGGGGGGGSSASSTTATTTAATSASSTLEMVACDMYLTTFIKPGAKNDSEQVKRLQSLLNESEGANVVVNGEYDVNTVVAVHAFQTKYAADILAPWGATKSTGFVYLTTRKKVNEVYCKLTKEFPLTTEEVETIAKTKVQITAPASAARSATQKVQAAPKAEPKVDESEVGSNTKETQTAAAGETATRSLNRLWDPVTGFLKRMFGR